MARPPVSKRLSEREVQVVLLMSFGYTDSQIGEYLFISKNTAHTHVGNILRKLGAHNKAHAVGIFYRVGAAAITPKEVVA